jgi:hypothetical protein
MPPALLVEAKFLGVQPMNTRNRVHQDIALNRHFLFPENSERIGINVILWVKRFQP